MPEKFDHALNDPAGAAIHAKEKNSEKRYRNNHDPGRHKHFMPRRPGHLAHLDANFVQKPAPSAAAFAPNFSTSRYPPSPPSPPPPRRAPSSFNLTASAINSF